MSEPNTIREISKHGSPPADDHPEVPRTRPVRAGATAVVVSLVFVLGACSGGGTKQTKPAEKATTTTTLPPAAVNATIADGATDVPLTSPIGVTVDHGTFETVKLSRGADAPTAPEPAPGVLNAAKTGWLSSADFAPHTPYRINATVEGVDGETSQHAWNFTTGAPNTEVHTSLNVGNDGIYGVGMPIIVKLDTPAPPALHKAVTDRLKVTSQPAVDGGWRWFSDSEVHYRPANYWPAHTKVKLDIDFAGLHLGNGVWGVDGRTVNFAIGDSHITRVDAAAHTMAVNVNGQTVATFPVSTGRPGPTTETRSGIHVVNEKSPLVVMDSSTIGIPVDSPEGYRIDAEWSVRISNSGEFVHSAPWSVDSQGHTNVSHGCVNAAPDNAKWFFELTMRGDVVEVVNTSRQLEPWNGYGDWQIPWAQWVN